MRDAARKSPHIDRMQTWGPSSRLVRAMPTGMTVDELWTGQSLGLLIPSAGCGHLQRRFAIPTTRPVSATRERSRSAANRRPRAKPRGRSPLCGGVRAERSLTSRENSVGAQGARQFAASAHESKTWLRASSIPTRSAATSIAASDWPPGSNARPIRQHPTRCAAFSFTWSSAVRTSVPGIGS
jgi:hypothetical protein